MAVSYLNQNNQAIYCGNSDDEKPIVRNGLGEEVPVQNGAIFFEMDTSKIYMFDKENKIWYEQEDGGSGGTIDHTVLENREVPDQHPIGAITGLESALEGKQEKGDYALKSEIPDKLPNPNALILTGGVSATYDGSAPVTVEISGGGSGGYPQDAPYMTHNLPRGKKLGNSVSEAQYAAIADGSFADMYVGDYWTINGRDYVIAGVNYYKNCGDTSFTKNHLVMVPRHCLYYAQMHNTESGGYEPGEANTTEGAYALSDMRTKNLEQARTIVNEAFTGHVLTHRIYLENAVSGGKPSNGAWFDSDVDLMNEQMVYGGPIWQNMLSSGNYFTKFRVEKSQLPVFAHAPELVNIRDSYWLRDVATAAYFAIAASNGVAAASDASGARGVRPAFAIG